MTKADFGAHRINCEHNAETYCARCSRDLPLHASQSAGETWQFPSADAWFAWFKANGSAR